MILFVPGIMPHPFTDPSYHLPGFYEFWARWGPVEDRAFWAYAAEVSQGSSSRPPIPRLAWRLTMPTSTARPSLAFSAVDQLRLRRLADGEQLVSRLVVVAQSSGRAAAERPHSELLRLARHRQLRPVYTLAASRWGHLG